MKAFAFLMSLLLFCAVSMVSASTNVKSVAPAYDVGLNHFDYGPTFTTEIDKKKLNSDMKAPPSGGVFFCYEIKYQYSRKIITRNQK